MPKQKSSRAAMKRFRVTGSGKVLRRKANKSHILTKKHPKRKRRLRHVALVAPAEAARIKTLLIA